MGTYTPFTAIASIQGESVAGESKRARDVLESMIRTGHSNTFGIARQLHLIKSKGYYDGFNTFTDYLGTLNFKLRKAQYLRRIAEVMDILGIPPEAYEQLGTTKLRQICSLDLDKTWTNPETNEEIPMGIFIAEFINKALHMSVEEIKAYVRTLKGLKPEDEMIGRHFYVSAQVLNEIVNPAVETAKRLIGSVGRDDEGMARDASDGRALEVICVEFLNDPANAFIANSTKESTKEESTKEPFNDALIELTKVEEKELEEMASWQKYWRNTNI